MYDYLIVTHIPVFYKVNLYNQLSKKLNIFVIFIASDTYEKRSDDFINIDKIKFKYKILYNGDFQDRNVRKNLFKIKELIKCMKFKRLLISGWDLKEFWYLIFTNSKSKNCLVLESTINESKIYGLKGFIKKIFLNRISTVFASGKLHVDLLNKLNYKNDIKITKGVGIINKPIIKYKKDNLYKKNFLFIGRLSKVKNIEMLINVFNLLNEFQLTIIGEGEDEVYLKNLSNDNIKYIGSVENKKLEKYFYKHDIFILPSLSEPWGLVVEEAFYFGLPVIISSNCGSSELVKDSINGYIIQNPKSEKSLRELILDIKQNNFLSLINGVKKFSIEEKDEYQVRSYL